MTMNRARGPNAPPQLAVVNHDFKNEDGPRDPGKVPISPPIELTSAQQAIWDRAIAGNPFLTSRSADKAFQYCELMARYYAAPSAFNASLLTQLDRLSADLYLDDAAVYRLQRSENGGQSNAKQNKASKYLSRRPQPVS